MSVFVERAELDSDLQMSFVSKSEVVGIKHCSEYCDKPD